MKKIFIAFFALFLMFTVASCGFFDDKVESLQFAELPAEALVQSETAQQLRAKVSVVGGEAHGVYELTVFNGVFSVTKDGAAVADPGFTVEGAEGLAANAPVGSYVLKISLEGITLIHSYRIVANASEVYFAAGSGTEEDPYLVESAQQLFNIRYAYENNGGNSYFKLANDINLTNFKWIAIGTQAKPFTGHIDGAGHKVTGLSNALTATSEMEQYIPGSSKVSGEVFGLIGYAGKRQAADAGDAVVEIKDLTLADVNIVGPNMKSAAALIGNYCNNAVDGEAYNNNKLLVSNVSVSGLISGKDKIAAFVGSAVQYSLKRASGKTVSSGQAVGIEITFVNCTNDANVFATLTEVDNLRAAAFIGQYGCGGNNQNGVITFDSCRNTGTITLSSNGVQLKGLFKGDFIGHFSGSGITQWTDIPEGKFNLLGTNTNTGSVVESNIAYKAKTENFIIQ